jgi:hypothetical protein
MTQQPPLEEGLPEGVEPVPPDTEIPADEPTPTEDTPPPADIPPKENGMKIFGREPALVVGAVNSLIMLAATLGYSFLTGEQAPLWVALVNGLSAAVLAVTTRPISAGVFSQLVAAIVALIGGYGISLSAEFVFALNGALVPILMFVTRGQVSPIESSVTQPSLEPTVEAARHDGTTPA